LRTVRPVAEFTHLKVCVVCFKMTQHHRLLNAGRMSFVVATTAALTSVDDVTKPLTALMDRMSSNVVINP